MGMSNVEGKGGERMVKNGTSGEEGNAKEVPVTFRTAQQRTQQRAKRYAEVASQLGKEPG